MAANEYPVNMVAYRNQSKGGKEWLRNVDGMHVSIKNTGPNVPKRMQEKGELKCTHMRKTAARGCIFS